MRTVTATVRLAEWLAREIRAFATEQGLKPSVGLARALQEWWVMRQFPGIEFRDGPAGRRAGLRAGPDVWELVMIARAYGKDRRRLLRHFGGHLSEEQLEEALAYTKTFPDEIDGWIAENERVGRMLEQRLGPPDAPRRKSG